MSKDMKHPLVGDVFTLHDDESVREKLRVMSKWDAMMDDARNPSDFGERVESVLEPGKTYHICVYELTPEKRQLPLPDKPKSPGIHFGPGHVVLGHDYGTKTEKPRRVRSAVLYDRERDVGCCDRYNDNMACDCMKEAVSDCSICRDPNCTEPNQKH